MRHARLPAFRDISFLIFSAGALAMLAWAPATAAEPDASPGGVPASEAQVVPLWKNGAPGFEDRAKEAEKVEEKGTPEKHSRVVSNIHNPNLTVFLPPKDKANGAAIVICPGGAHRFHSIDFEGYEVARYLNSQGVAGLVLKYRLSSEQGSPYKLEDHVLADARRALRLTRSRASEWNIDPNRVGLMGFSAGSQLSILAGTKYDAGDPTAADPIDRLNSRPDFMVLVYGGFPSSAIITPETPPTFIAVAADDERPAKASLDIFQELRKNKVPAELHIYGQGGHGFGMKNRPLAVTGWSTRLTDWMADRGYMKRP